MSNTRLNKLHQEHKFAASKWFELQKIIRQLKLMYYLFQRPTSGISKNSNEGYFVEKLDNYLRVKGFNYINIHKEKILSKSDYWTHEGYNNTSGNEKIVKSAFKSLK